MRSSRLHRHIRRLIAKQLEWVRLFLSAVLYTAAYFVDGIQWRQQRQPWLVECVLRRFQDPLPPSRRLLHCSGCLVRPIDHPCSNSLTIAIGSAKAMGNLPTRLSKLACVLSTGRFRRKVDRAIASQVDLKISGGPTGAQPTCPLWQGGDTSEKSDTACVYVSVNNPSQSRELNQCFKC